MKNVLLIVVLFTSVLVYSQDRPDRQGPRREPAMQGEKMGMAPGLTDSQKEQIKAIRLEHAKSVKPLKNELGEKRARLRTLTTAETTDKSAVSSLVDEMNQLRGEIFKGEVMARLKVRDILTEEQKLHFDNMQKKGKKNNMKHRPGRPHPGK